MGNASSNGRHGPFHQHRQYLIVIHHDDELAAAGYEDIGEMISQVVHDAVLKENPHLMRLQVGVDPLTVVGEKGPEPFVVPDDPGEIIDG